MENREIKFRAWDSHKKKYREDFAITSWGLPFDFYEGCFDEGQMYERERYVLEMFTGLKDKNGTEIYEGDILHIWSTFYEQNMPIAKVFWNTTLSKFDIKVPTGLYHPWLSNAHRKGWNLEIIGNIHQNKELMQ